VNVRIWTPLRAASATSGGDYTGSELTGIFGAKLKVVFDFAQKGLIRSNLSNVCPPLNEKLFQY